MSNDDFSFYEKVLFLINRNIDFVIITLTDIKGSAPQNLGAKMIVSNKEILFGTVGGGKIENHCLNFSAEFSKSKEKMASRTWNLQKDIGMTCGGHVSLLFENFSKSSDWNIAIFGAGHVSQALVRILLSLNCKLAVIEEREEWLDLLPKDNNLKIIKTNELSEYVHELADNTFIVSITKGHSFDLPILFNALSLNKFPFIGVIGSVSKRNAIERELKDLGLEPSLLKNLICPVGEKFGTNDPAEIAISITAQLLRYRDNLTR